MIGIESLRAWRFGVLLLVVLCALVVEPIVFGPRASSWIFDIVYSLILISAVFAILGRGHRRAWMIGIGLVTLSATWVHHFTPDPLLKTGLIVHHVVGIGFLLVVVVATLRDLFCAEEITLDIVLGTMAGYLLLGTAWGLIYSLIHLLSPDAFLVGDALPFYIDDRHSRLAVFVYYSFVTLTTLGFGDMSPVSQAARTLSWLEAAVGQFYIATLVAGFVGSIVSRGSRRIAKETTAMVDSARPRRTPKQ